MVQTTGGEGTKDSGESSSSAEDRGEQGFFCTLKAAQSRKWDD